MTRPRLLPSLAGMMASAFMLSACLAPEGAHSSGGEDVTLRFAFWGLDTRVQNTEQIIEEVNEDHPSIQVDIEYSDWSGFWDQLNTQIAGEDAPDIFQMDAPYLREYGERGSLMDLSGVDLSHIPEEIVASGTIDGEYYGLASGVNAVAIAANPRLF